MINLARNIKLMHHLHKSWLKRIPKTFNELKCESVRARGLVATTLPDVGFDFGFRKKRRQPPFLIQREPAKFIYHEL
ncbi:hypothetical protein HanIR_Chr03g0123321 [Helianthus annuus]|nr:hypothetical protein HanIR_Chr03g0123321 [Helianthus annuus]